MTFWMALAIKQMANDKWNSIGYQIMLESKTSLNNSIIFFEIDTFIRALTRDLDMSLLTHLIIDVNDLTSLFFNLFLLYLKENMENLDHLNMIFLTQDSKRSQKMIDYFGPNVFYNNMADRNLTNYNMAKLQYFFLDDLQPMSITSTSSLENLNQIQQVTTTSIHENHSELIIFECWTENVEINKMIEFFQMFPWQINYQCKRIEGITPLITAIVRGNHTNVYQLLKMGANPCLASRNGLEPIQWAINFRQQQTFQLLFVHLYTMNVSFDLHIRRYLNFPHRPLSMTNPINNQSYHSKVNYNLILQLLYNMIKQLYHNHWTTMNQRSSIGSILIMLPSYNHVSTLRKLIISSMIEIQIEFTIFCLYPNVPNNELDAGIEISSSSSNHIRVILSTFNVDSILFKDVYFIINTGNRLMKMPNSFSDSTLFRMVPNPTENIETKFILANNQTFPVIIWNLYRRDEFFDYEIDSMENPISIHSNDSLYHCIFAAKFFKFKNIGCLMDIFDRMILPPNKEIIYRALNFMQNINVLDTNENMTTLGRMLIDISIEPHYAKMIIVSILLRCLDPILTIVCALSSPKSLYQQLQFLDENNQQQDEFHSIHPGTNNLQTRLSKNSDHLNLVYAFQKWQEICRLNAKSYCSMNQTFSKTAKIMNQNEFKESFATFEMIYSLRTKILGQLRAIGLVKGKGLMNIRYLNSNSENFSLILAAVTGGQLFDHFAQIIDSYSRQCHSSNPNEILYMEPNSILNLSSSNNIESMNDALILFDRKIQCGQISYIQNCTIINPLTFIIFVDDNSIDYNRDRNCIEFMNGQFEFHNDDDDDGSGNNLEKLFVIRQRWQQLIRKRLENMQQVFNEDDENFLENMINLITVADESYGFGPHPNIGRAPQVMSTYFCSTIRIKK
nr:3'-5' RNA helicase YTHDC2-like isoform X2 [Dermatophagoides farinae]